MRVRLSAADRASLERRLSLRVDRRTGGPVSFGELSRSMPPEPQPLVHKDLKPVVYVFGDLAGERESPVYALAALNGKIDALRCPGAGMERLSIAAPLTRPTAWR